MIIPILQARPRHREVRHPGLLVQTGAGMWTQAAWALSPALSALCSTAALKRGPQKTFWKDCPRVSFIIKDWIERPHIRLSTEEELEP